MASLGFTDADVNGRCEVEGRVGSVYPGQEAHGEHEMALDDPARRLDFTVHLRFVLQRHLIERNLCLS